MLQHDTHVHTHACVSVQLANAFGQQFWQRATTCIGMALQAAQTPLAAVAVTAPLLLPGSRHNNVATANTPGSTAPLAPHAETAGAAAASLELLASDTARKKHMSYIQVPELPDEPRLLADQLGR